MSDHLIEMLRNPIFTDTMRKAAADEITRLRASNAELLAALIAIEGELVLPPQLQEIMSAAIERAGK